jgi:hypothetical protein
MRNIIDYTVSETTDLQELEDDAIALVAEGWQPFGNLQVTTFWVKPEELEPCENCGEREGFRMIQYNQPFVKYASHGVV